MYQMAETKTGAPKRGGLYHANSWTMDKVGAIQASQTWT